VTAADVAELDPALAPDQVFARLPALARTAVHANATLYVGNWDDFAEDLRRRQAGRPYLFKIEAPTADVLAWVLRLRDYETARGERLSGVASATEP